jgi:hypothetical protein
MAFTTGVLAAVLVLFSFLGLIGAMLLHWSSDDLLK